MQGARGDIAVDVAGDGQVSSLPTRGQLIHVVLASVLASTLAVMEARCVDRLQMQAVAVLRVLILFVQVYAVWAAFGVTQKCTPATGAAYVYARLLRGTSLLAGLATTLAFGAGPVLPWALTAHSIWAAAGGLFGVLFLFLYLWAMARVLGLTSDAARTSIGLFGLVLMYLSWKSGLLSTRADGGGLLGMDVFRFLAHLAVCFGAEMVCEAIYRWWRLLTTLRFRNLRGGLRLAR